MEKKEIIVVGFGELLYDVFIENDKIIEKKAGGAPINFVYHATQQGAKGYAISAIGGDELGKKIFEELKSNSINRDYISITDKPTGTVDVYKQEEKHTFIINRSDDSDAKVAWENIPLLESSIKLMECADAVCFGTLALYRTKSQKTLIELLKHVPERALRFFDINIRQDFYDNILIKTLLKEANILKINDEELEILRSIFKLRGTDNEVCHWFLDTYQLKYVILTAGAVCSTIYSKTEISCIWTPADKVKEVIALANNELKPDTVGAGDSFSGTFVYSILAGETMREAHKKAVDVSAFVCTQVGAWPSYDNYEPWKFVEKTL